MGNQNRSLSVSPLSERPVHVLPINAPPSETVLQLAPLALCCSNQTHFSLPSARCTSATSPRAAFGLRSSAFTCGNDHSGKLHCTVEREKLQPPRRSTRRQPSARRE